MIYYIFLLLFFFIACSNIDDYDNKDFTSEAENKIGFRPFIAVGGAGGSEIEYAILYSDDGDNWKALSLINFNLNAGYGFKAVTYGKEYVVVGESGFFMKSKDGYSWELEKNNDDFMEVRYSIAYGNNKYVAVGGSNAGNSKLVIKSNNGFNWGNSNFNTTINESIKSVSFCLKKFYLIHKNTLYSSTDGNNWLNISGINNASAYLSCANNKLFLAVNSSDYVGKDILYTDNQETFNRIENIGSFKKIVYGNGVYVILNDSGLKLSAVLNTGFFQQVFTGSNLYDMTFRNNKFIVVGSSGLILTSIDGTIWEAKLTPTNSSLFGVY